MINLGLRCKLEIFLLGEASPVPQDDAPTCQVHTHLLSLVKIPDVCETGNKNFIMNHRRFDAHTEQNIDFDLTLIRVPFRTSSMMSYSNKPSQMMIGGFLSICYARYNGYLRMFYFGLKDFIVVYTMSSTLQVLLSIS